MVSRTPGTLLPLVAAALLLTGCAQTNAERDETDAQRLAALEAAPPFDVTPYGATWEATEARGAFSSTNAVAYRAQLRADFPLDTLAPDPSFDTGWAVTFPLARDLLAELRGAGWSPVSVACEAPASTTGTGTVQIYATGPIEGDVVAALDLRIGTGGDEVVAEAVVPFHTEGTDPWGAAPLGEDTCLDATSAPTDSAAAGTPLDLGDVRP